jgi:hypothetical protein
MTVIISLRNFQLYLSAFLIFSETIIRKVCMSADRLQKIKDLSQRIDAIDLAVERSEENGLFKKQTEGNVGYIREKIRAARSNLESDPPDITSCRSNVDAAYQEYHKAFTARGKGMGTWRFFNMHAYDLFAYFLLVLIFVIFLYFFVIHCDSSSTLCYIGYLGLTNKTGNTTSITNTTGSTAISAGPGIIDERNMSRPISSSTVLPWYPKVALPQNGVYATLWGVVGGVLKGFLWLGKDVWQRKFRNVWRFWAYSVPIISGILGAIVFFLIAGGLLLLSQDTTQANTSKGTIAIIIAAGFSGYNWDRALEWFSGASARFSSGGTKE